MRQNIWQIYRCTIFDNIWQTEFCTDEKRKIYQTLVGTSSLHRRPLWVLSRYQHYLIINSHLRIDFFGEGAKSLHEQIIKEFLGPSLFLPLSYQTEIERAVLGFSKQHSKGKLDEEWDRLSRAWRSRQKLTKYSMRSALCEMGAPLISKDITA